MIFDKIAEDDTAFAAKKSFWYIWAKTLGNKISDDRRVADTAAFLRTLWVTLQVITCLAIIANCIRHW